jgi:PEGA domain
MRKLARIYLPAFAGLLATFALAPLSRAESLNITSAPSGANVEIDGGLVGTTPFHTDYPGGYFHKTHTVFGARLEHSMTLRISKDGYATQQITITDGPFEWIAVSGKHHGNYFVLKSDHFDMKLAQGAESATTTWAGDARVGPVHPHAVTAALSDESEKSHSVGTQNVAAGSVGSGSVNAGSAGPTSFGTGSLAIASDPAGAEIYVDAHFVGQTPATLHLPAGLHRIELRANGKKDWSRELEVIKDSEVTVHPTMERSQ